MSTQQEKFTEIADAIRAKTGKTDSIKPSEFAGKISDVYDAGKQAEYDAFWDVYQKEGSRNNYRYAFYNTSWTDDNYNPKYPIVCTAVSSSMFEYSGITDTKVDITISVSGTGQVFKTTNLEKIRKLILTEAVTFNQWFADCTALKEITIEGAIGNNIDFQYSTLLTHESLMSIINALTETTEIRTLTLGTTNQEKLTDTEKAIATSKGWTLA